MTSKIDPLDEYQKLFNEDGKQDRALKCALDIRKFEIDLYWKRAGYFWTLIGATFAGYGAIYATSPNSEGLILLLSCVGFIFSLSWYLVNRGSKFWQNNWEMHVDYLEDTRTGPLYKTVIDKTQFSWFDPFSAYPYSVSKINQIASLFITLIWLGMALNSFINAYPPAQGWLPAWLSSDVKALLVVAFTLLFTALLFLRGRSGDHEERRMSFTTAQLNSSNDEGPQ